VILRNNVYYYPLNTASTHTFTNILIYKTKQFTIVYYIIQNFVYYYKIITAFMLILTMKDRSLIASLLGKTFREKFINLFTLFIY